MLWESKAMKGAFVGRPGMYVHTWYTLGLRRGRRSHKSDVCTSSPKNSQNTNWMVKKPTSRQVVGVRRRSGSKWRLACLRDIGAGRELRPKSLPSHFRSLSESIRLVNSNPNPAFFRRKYCLLLLLPPFRRIYFRYYVPTIMFEILQSRDSISCFRVEC